MVGVIAGEPLEACGIEILAPQCRRCLVQLVQVGDKLLHALMIGPFKGIPVDGAVVVPLAILGDFIAHEGEVLARMSPLVGEQRTDTGILLPIVARHLAKYGTLAVHNLVMADRQHIVF